MPDVLTDQKTYLRAVLVGGGLVAAVVGGVALTAGLVGGGEAGTMLQAALPTVRFLSSAVMTASATTLALLLTLISFGKGTDEELDRSFYRQIRQTARLAVGAFIGATLLLTAIVIPFGEESGFSETAYTVLYYVFTGGGALVAGALVAVVLSLYRTVDGLIEAFWGEGSRYVEDDGD